MLKIVFLATLLAGSAASAAVTITSTVGPDSGAFAGQSVITNFDSAAGLSGSFLLANGSVSGQYAGPFQDHTQYLNVFGGNSATLTLAKAARSLSFYWGSIDAYNTVSFFSGSTLLGSFTGADVPFAPDDGLQTSPLDNRRVNFAFSGPKVTSVVFASSQNSFELDTVAGTVPEPATWAMLITGMGLVGVSMRRRKRMTAVSA